MFNNFIGSLLGSVVNYGINAISSPTFQIDNQITQIQKQLNEKLSSQMAMLNQGMLGSANSGNNFNGLYQMASFMPMITGLNSFYGQNINAPAVNMPVGSNNTAVNTVDVNAQELSASMSPKTRDRDQLIISLLGFDDNLVLISKDAETQKKAYVDYQDTINKLKEDLKDVPVEALELLSKNGTKINILSKNNSLEKTGLIKNMDSSQAEAEQDKIIEKLNAIKEAGEFKKLDPKVLKKNLYLPIFTYVPTKDDTGSRELKGIGLFEGQVTNELANIYFEGKNASPDEIRKFKEEMGDTHKTEAGTKNFVASWKKKKAENVNNPAEVEKINKILVLEDMLAIAKQAPVKHEGKYYKAEDYEVIKQWNNGTIESLYSKKDKTVYLKDEVLGKMMSDKDPGKVAVHELGHAIEDAVKNLSPNFGKKLVEKVKQNYNANRSSDNDPYNINSNGRNEFISAYSSTSEDEYFAETLSAYFYPEKANILKQNDPNQYNLIAEIFKEFGKAKRIAVQNGALAA